MGPFLLFWECNKTREGSKTTLLCKYLTTTTRLFLSENLKCFQSPLVSTCEKLGHSEMFYQSFLFQEGNLGLGLKLRKFCK